MTTDNLKQKAPDLTTDWHCHILPGVDDGSSSLEESLQMAAILRRAGFRRICCTPHYLKGSYDMGTKEVRAAVASLQRALNEAGIDLTLFAGREYYLDEFFQEQLTDLLPLADTSCVLVEIPATQDPENVKQTCYRLRLKGYTPVIAHPERCRLLIPPRPEGEEQGARRLPLFLQRVQRIFRPVALSRRDAAADQPGADSGDAGSDLCAYLAEIGAGFQGNVGSLTGLYGETPTRRARRFRSAGLYTHYGSDAHSSDDLETWLMEGLALIR